MFPCTKRRKQSSADCCRRSKVFTIRIRSALPYRIDTENDVCATYIYANTDWCIFRTRKRSHACVAYTMVKSVLLRWTPSLNDCSKLKGQYTDVKSGSGISVGPSLKPQSQLKLNSCDTVPLKFCRYKYKLHTANLCRSNLVRFLLLARWVKPGLCILVVISLR